LFGGSSSKDNVHLPEFAPSNPDSPLVPEVPEIPEVPEVPESPPPPDKFTTHEE
jgi:hypothetical protein